MTDHDPVTAPSHYRWLPGDIEVIDITEGLSFCHGNVLKYVLRADHKGRPIEDLKKARWYLDREIDRREAIAEDEAWEARQAAKAAEAAAAEQVDARVYMDCVTFERCGRENCWYCG